MISLIVTTHKRPRLLLRALQSALTQDIPKGIQFEIIVSDDDPAGSGLEAFQPLQRDLGASIPLHYIKRGSGKGGVALARNRGLETAKGRWIAFLDDDDLLLSGALHSLHEAISIREADFCAGAYIESFEDTDLNTLSETRVEPRFSRDRLLLENIFPIGSFLIDRNIIKERFLSLLETHEDWLFLLSNLENASVVVIDKPVLNVRKTASASRKHRNSNGGQDQLVKDHVRIYSLHPEPSAYEGRRRKLTAMGYPTIDSIIGGPNTKPNLSFVETKQGRFLISNPLETIQRALITGGAFEPLSIEIAQAIIESRPGTVIDVGANIGTFTVPVASAFPECTVLSIEPQRMVFMNLCANILENRLLNVEPLNVAISDSQAQSKISVPLFDPFGERYTGSVSLDKTVQLRRSLIHGIEEPSLRATQYSKVSETRLDDIAQDYDVVFIKIDVEGMEEAVLKGASELINRCRPTLFFEAWTLPEFDDHRHSLITFARGLGYRLYQVGEDCLGVHVNVTGFESFLSSLDSLGLRIQEEPR